MFAFSQRSSIELIPTIQACFSDHWNSGPPRYRPAPPRQGENPVRAREQRLAWAGKAEPGRIPLALDRLLRSPV